MKIKTILLLFILLSTNSFAEEINSLADALTQGKVKGLFRYNGMYRDTDLHLLQDSSTANDAANKKQQYSALGGYVGYETAPWFHTSIGATIYSSNPVGNNPDDRRGLGGLDEKNGEQDSYSVWGEAFVKLEKDGHLVKVGRQEMPNYRFVSLSNIRMTPVTHQGVVYENNSFENFNFNLAYIGRMKERNAEEFVDMAEGARIKASSNGKQLIRGGFDSSDYNDNEYIGDNKQMSMMSLIYNKDDLTLEGWNYYVNDFINTTYLYGQYDIKANSSDLKYTLATQYANQSDVGDHIAGNIDSWFYGLKFQVYTQGLTVFTSFNEVEYNENSYDGGTLFVRWGTPQMFNSFQAQDSELAGTKSYGIGLQYDFGHDGILPGFVMRLRYADYRLPDSLNDADARQDRTETTFDLRYSFAKTSGFGLFTTLDGLSVMLRIAYDNYDTDYDFDAYKQLHGYSFDSVTDDFVDARLYIDYQF